VGQGFAVPNLFQVGYKLRKRRQRRLRHVYFPIVHTQAFLFDFVHYPAVQAQSFVKYQACFPFRKMFSPIQACYSCALNFTPQWLVPLCSARFFTCF
ncbi:MAG: hypothetical protein ACK5Q1_11700, partial [Limnobacter sp.]